MNAPDPQAVQFAVPALTLHGQRWHAGGIPVIALHGWLDNSESFSAMAPAMPDIDLVALDLAGHGWSGHRSADASYLIWDDLRDILAVADALGWPRFSVLGHSRGGIVAALLAAAAPERVVSLGLVDGLWAKTRPAAQAPAQLGRSLAAARQREQRPPPAIVPSLELLVEQRLRNGFPLSRDAATRLTRRNASQAGEGWAWRTDPRLRDPSAFMLTPEQEQAFHQALALPVDLTLAREGLVLAWPDYAHRLAPFPAIRWRVMEGGHHLHMEGAHRILGEHYNHFFTQVTS